MIDLVATTEEAAPNPAATGGGAVTDPLVTGGGAEAGPLAAWGGAVAGPLATDGEVALDVLGASALGTAACALRGAVRQSCHCLNT